MKRSILFRAERGMWSVVCGVRAQAINYVKTLMTRRYFGQYGILELTGFKGGPYKEGTSDTLAPELV